MYVRCVIYLVNFERWVLKQEIQQVTAILNERAGGKGGRFTGNHLRSTHDAIDRNRCNWNVKY